MKSRPASARSGLLAGGTWIVDQVKMIDVYPQPEQLANIGSQAQGTGGAPYNVLIDLAKLGVPFPLSAAGLVGKDALASLFSTIARSIELTRAFCAPRPALPLPTPT